VSNLLKVPTTATLAIEQISGRFEGKPTLSKEEPKPAPNGLGLQEKPGYVPAGSTGLLL